jgi:hypothetical protein
VVDYTGSLEKKNGTMDTYHEHPLSSATILELAEKQGFCNMGAHLECFGSDLRRFAELVYDMGYSKGYEEGYKIGLEDGDESGHSSGYLEGYGDGLNTP